MTLPPKLKGLTRWMTASVPGTVHTDLLAAGKIPDPFYRLNENEVQWVDAVQWRYRRDFRVPGRLLNSRRLVLIAEGLDTYATVFLNGKSVAQWANMFIAQRVDVTRRLRAGRNTIEILFDSPTIRAGRLEKKHGRLLVSHGHERVYVRKAQYSFGWDWGPKLTTSGIWRSISIEAASDAQLAYPFVRVLSAGKSPAEIEVSVEVRHRTNDPLELHAVITGGAAPINHVMPVKNDRATFRLRIPDPGLWWPNGMGKQPMYSARLSLVSGSREVHRLEVPFALRTVRLIQERDREGRSFILEINGVRVYCKGADWIPSDTFLPRIPESTYEKLLTMARDAHMNMIRVWGGGIYEQDIFYNLCDRLGLMVWQDFMYACAEYPEEPWFLEQARTEAEKVVKRLRNHPSIVIWCGNNENEWLYCMRNPGRSPDSMTGAGIFRDLLRRVCREFDGTRPYWRSSPFGTGFPNDESNGNHHQWNVWSSWRDYAEYESDNARFVTEFGFQAVANLETMKSAMAAADDTIQSLVMEHHNKQAEGPERLIRFQAAHYRLAGNLERFIYKSQLVQAEALKRGVEHWRRRKFLTAGSLFWQLNDCWPVSSWAVIDSGLRPKAAYFYAKRFFSPVLVSFKRTTAGVEVWVTNDRREGITGALELALRSFSGKRVWRKSMRVNAGANSSRRVYRIDKSSYGSADEFTHYLWAGLSDRKGRLSENRFFFAEAKHLALPKPHIRVRITKSRGGKRTVELRSDKFVSGVRLSLPGKHAAFSDNFIDIDPGGRSAIPVDSPLPAGELKRRLKITWL